MALETVLLALLGVVAVGLAVDACRERHRLRARMDRAERRMRVSRAEDFPRGVSTSHRALPQSASSPRPSANTGGVGPGAWRYWPLALPSTDETGRR